MSAPSAWTLERVVAVAQAALDNLRETHGQMIETDGDVVSALNDEGIDIGTILQRLVRAEIQAEANQGIANQRINDLIARRNRFKAHREAYRYTTQMVLEALIPPDNQGVRRYADPEFGLTLTPGTRRPVVITDADALPDELVEIRIVRTPNLAAIKAALDAEQDVPGAEFAEMRPVLTIRTK